MKKYLLFLPVFLVSFLSQATVHIINMTGSSTFSPNMVNASVGDTIRWVALVSGHTTTSTSVPQGAATWNQSMAMNQTFNYVLTVAGTYNYHCVPHSPSMAGTINASPVSGLNTSLPSAMDILFEDLGDEIWVSVKDYQPKLMGLQMFSLDGKSVMKREISGSRIQIPLYNLKAGIYVVKLRIDEMWYERRVQAGGAAMKGGH